MNKKVGALSMAFTFAGCLLGAGYVSGNELWQYFGLYGDRAIVGIALALVLIGAVCYASLVIAEKSGCETMDEILIRWDIPWLHAFVKVLFSLIYAIITVVMLAGLSALFQQMLGVNKYIASLIAVVPVICCVYFGITGMLTVFNFAIPVLVVAAVCICVFRIASFGPSNITYPAVEANPLLGNWFSSAINYAALNILGAFGIIAPVGRLLTKKSSGLGGIVLGFLFLLAVGSGILIAMFTSPASVETDLPMLDMAGTMSPVIGVIYAILLFLAMFGNSVATLVAVLEQMKGHTPLLDRHRLIFMCILGVICYLISLTGFSNLVGTVYPILGYIGIAATLLILEHLIHVSKSSPS